jgi:hypothetical protein
MEKRMLDMSILGFGCMRFAKKGGKTDMEEATREVLYAIDHGVNYFDTAYVYGNNEKVLGEIISKNGIRERMILATKLPHYLIHSVEGAERLFNEQLERLQTDYIDNYLMHMLPDVNIWNALVEMGIAEWLQEKKRQGKIRHIGFSYHGNTENFIKLVDAYDWEFCQVQYNYMDEHTQAGRAGVEHAHAKGLPVIIMEPLRGGRLVNNLPPKAVRAFEEITPKRSPAEWALRWLWDQEAVSCVLSGMNSMEMLEENIRIAENVRAGEFSREEQRMLDTVKEAINEKVKVGCTGCGYCQPCPFGVDIPGIFRCYNECFTDNYFTGFREYVMCTTFKATPTYASLCKKCGKCEQHCPQNIHIREELDRARKKLENPAFHVANAGSKVIFRKGRKKLKDGKK